VVALAPPLSVTVAPEMAAPPEAVTVPLTDPGVGVRLKLKFWVVWPAATVADNVLGSNPAAEAVSAWVPGASPDRV